MAKIIATEEFNKIAKKKKWDPNPFAICKSQINKGDMPKSKEEDCIKEIKKKQSNSDMINPIPRSLPY